MTAHRFERVRKAKKLFEKAMAHLYPEHAAVYRLQDAARTGRPALIPGALESARLRPTGLIEPPALLDPPSTAASDHPTTTAADREDWGKPKAPVTLLDRLARVALRAVEAIIRLLGTRSAHA
jgi:hypothetical protein